MFCKSTFKALFSAAFALCLAQCARANIEWVGGSSGNWDDSTKWSGTVEPHRFNYSTMNGTAATVAFGNAETLDAGLWVENNLSGSVTFTADSLGKGLTQTGGNLHLGTGTYGVLAINGGTYHFANDILVGIACWANNARGDFTLLSGRVETSYWMVLGTFWTGDGASWHTGAQGNVTVSGGELVVGYRDGSTQNDGVIEMGRAAESITTFMQNGGGVSSEKGMYSYTDSALVIGSADNTTATYTISNGTYTARSGNVLIANGTGSMGTLNICGGTFTAEAITNGLGTATVNLDGGTLAAKADGTLIASGVTLKVGGTESTIELTGQTVTIDGDVAGVYGTEQTTGVLKVSGWGKLIVTGEVKLDTLTVAPSEYYKGGSDYTLTLDAKNVFVRHLYGSGNITTRSGVNTGDGAFYGKISGAGGLRTRSATSLYGLHDFAGSVTFAENSSLLLVSSLDGISPLWRVDADAADSITVNADGKVTAWASQVTTGDQANGTFSNESSAMVKTDAYYGGKTSVLTSGSALTSSWTNDGANDKYHTKSLIGSVAVANHNEAAILLKYNVSDGKSNFHIGRYNSANDKWDKQRGSGQNNMITDGIWQNGEYGDREFYSEGKILSVIGWNRYSNATSITIGGGANASVAIGELLAFNSNPSNAQRKQIETYLANKWNITGMGKSLPEVAVVMGSGCMLDLGGLDVTVKSFVGPGTVQNGTLRTVGGTYTQGAGDLTIPAVEGGTYYASVGGGKLVITGGAGKNVTIVLPEGWEDTTGDKLVCDANITLVNNGSLTVAGGTLSLVAVSGSGTLTLDGGTLAALASGSLIASGSRLVLGSNGGIVDTQAFNVTVDGVVSGEGDFTKRGSGSLEFTAAPDFSGVITVANGSGTVTLPSGADGFQPGLYTKARTETDGRIVFYNAYFDNHWNAGGGTATDWNNVYNWDTRLEGAANYVFHKNYLNGSAVAVTFAEACSIPTGLWIENNASGTVTFSGSQGTGLTIGTLGSDDQGLNIGTGQAGGSLIVDGVRVQSCHDLKIGNSGDGHLTVRNDGVVKCLSNEGWAKWVVLGVGGSNKSVSITLESGGTLEAWHIQRYTTSGSCDIHLNGGTLRALASTQLIGDNWSQGRYPTTTVWEGGGTIDTQGFDVTIDAPVTGSGPIFKSGSGTLTITGDMSGFTGTITVPEGCGSVTVPVGSSAKAGEGTKRVSSDAGIVFYNDDGSLSVASGEERVLLGHRRITNYVHIEGSLKLGTPADLDGCTLSHDFAADTFADNFSNAGGDLVWTDVNINGRSAVHSDTFCVQLNESKASLSTFAVVQSVTTPSWCRLLQDGAQDKWGIQRRGEVNNFWARRYAGSNNWDATTDGMWHNGESGCPLTTEPFVLSIIGKWTSGSASKIRCGDGRSSMTWGEVVLYSRELDDDERVGVEDYLMAKWGFTEPKFIYQPLCELNDVTQASGATLNLGGLNVTVKSFTGSGTVENGTLSTVSGLIYQGDGKLTIPAAGGATYVASSSHNVLEITGAAGKSVTVRFPSSWYDQNSSKKKVLFCEGTPNFVWEGTAIDLYDFGDGWWGFYDESSDIGSFSDSNEYDNAYEEEQSDDESGLAFPGAHGWGRFAKGARASSSPTIYRVTSLANSGSGTLREAVSSPNRIIIFDVSGVINITSRISFSSNLYIAGQTAPGEGITVYGDGCSFSGANNIICRYLRWRMGHGGSSGKDCAGIANGANMIFDHCSFSWGLDETFSINPDGKGTPPQNITLQNCIFGQGLMTHSAGGLMQADYVTLYRNLYVDNSTRNNKVKGINQYANNIVYNWKNGCYIMGGDSSGSSYCSIEGNLFINGPVSSSSNALGGGNSDFHFYGNDNWQDKNRNGRLDPDNIDGSQTGGGAYTSDKSSLGVAFPDLPLYPGNSLLAANLRKVGASLPYRDQADCLMVEDVNSIGRSGGLITYESSLHIGAPSSWSWWGGTAKAADRDNDCIPDWWEDANGTNSGKHDSLVKASNGRLNIENYINSINADDRQYFLRAPIGLSAVSDTTTTIKLSWHDYTYGELGFSVEAQINGEWKEVGRTLANANNCRITGLTHGTYYNVRVRAVGSNNGVPAYSDYATLRVSTRQNASEEVDIDTYEQDYTLADGQAFWDATHRYWVENSFFQNGGKVLLNTDGTQTVNIQDWVSPESVVVNGTGDLTLRKLGYLANWNSDANTSINKGNTGSLTLLGSSGYKGKIVNHEGMIYFDTIANGGYSSSLGAASSDPVNWVFDGGGYVYTGGAASSDRGMQFRRTSSFGVSGSSLTLTGAIDGPGDFILDGGDGMLTIPDANTFFGSKKRGAIIKRGTLYLSTTGDSGSARNFANGNTVTNIVLAGGHVRFASANEEYQTYSVPIRVEENTTSYITLATHCYFKSRMSGTGDVQFNISYVRSYIDKDSKINNFEGNIIANGTASGATFFHEGCWNCPSTRFTLTGTIGMVSKTRHARCFLGGLSGDSGTELMGSDTKSADSGTMWTVGSANSDETFAGVINDWNADHKAKGTTSITKVGTGFWRLTGNNTYSGTTTVNGGELIVNGTIQSTAAVAVNDGATLKGEGTVNGSISINSGATLEAGDETLYNKSLRTNGNVTFYGGSTCKAPLFWSSSKGAKSNCFKANTGTTWTIKSGTTLELNTGNVELFNNGDKYYVFASDGIPKFSGTFSAISPSVPDKDFTWDTSKLYTDGYVTVVANEGYEPPSSKKDVPARYSVGNLSFRDASYIMHKGRVYGTPDNYTDSGLKIHVDEIYHFRSLFELVLNETADPNVYVVSTELTPAAKVEIAESAQGVAEELVGGLSTVAEANGDTYLRVYNIIPGLYYSVASSGRLDGNMTEGPRVEAASLLNNRATNLVVPHYDGAGFYKVVVNLFQK